MLQDRGMTQTDLHRQSGIGYSTINGMVLNKARQVSLATLDALADVLDCEPGELIGREPQRKRR
jgi:putative transcriptional regulator